MEIYTIYMLFAATTAFAAIYELFIPIVGRYEREVGPLENKHIWYFVMFILALLAAPAVFFCCILPDFSARFQDTFYKTALLNE